MRSKIQMLSLLVLSGLAVAARRAPVEPVDGAAPPPRGMLIVVSSAASPVVRTAAEAVLAGAHSSPLLRAFGDKEQAKIVTSEDFLAAKINERAYNHLVLVGLPDDPVIQQTWLQEARAITVDGTNGLYVFGWGNLLGDIGYLESDRNPFLHSTGIKKAPFETEEVTLSGSTPAGVKLAVDAFLRTGLVNGVIGGSGWKRGETTLLDRDPLKPDFSKPDIFPEGANGWTRIGITPASEDEYRGVLSDTGIEPAVIWRAKYYQPGAWDGAGADNAIADYLAGLHRQSYGNTVWAAKFESAARAAEAAPKIAAAAHLKKEKDGYTGAQPTPGNGPSSGALSLWQNQDWVFMSTLPHDVRIRAGR